MGKLRWYKRDPDAALNGMANLTLEERGAYNTVLDLIYSRDGAVDDDDRFIAGWLRCDVRVWRRIRARLLELGKLYVADGSLRNSRADVEVDRGLQRVASVQDANRIKGQKSGAARRKNNDLSEPGANQKRTQLQPQPEEDSEANASAPASPGAPVDVRTELFRKGLARLVAISGRPERVCRSLIGKWLKAVNDDAVKILRAIEDAERDRVLDPVPWLERRCGSRGPPKDQPSFREIAANLRNVANGSDHAPAQFHPQQPAEPPDQLDLGGLPPGRGYG